MEKQPRKTINDVAVIINEVTCPPYDFRLMEKGDGWLLQLRYLEEDVDAPGRQFWHTSRKWYISPYATTTEIVETAYGACLRSAKHRIREHFTYKDRRVMSPHLDIEARIEICDARHFDQRIPRKGAMR